MQHNIDVDAINLSILDFKYRTTGEMVSFGKTINLSILDFKLIALLIGCALVPTINLSILDFKYRVKNIISIYTIL